jgi:hypothetical protein
MVSEGSHDRQISGVVAVHGPLASEGSAALDVTPDDNKNGDVAPAYASRLRRG